MNKTVSYTTIQQKNHFFVRNARAVLHIVALVHMAVPRRRVFEVGLASSTIEKIYHLIQEPSTH